METTITKRLNAFEKEVKKGLTRYPKKIASKFIYDKRGDELFQQIMAMPEYYLTQCEFNILKQNCDEICAVFDDPNGFDLIELGAGDGKKTKILLRELNQLQADFTYLPIDISLNALNELNTSIHKELPKVDVKIQQGMYFDVLQELESYTHRKKIILVLGSNIGNLMHSEAIDFLRKISESMNKNDLLFMGFDQKKDPEKILNAYNDPNGITEAFNKNLLLRMNNELQANFDLSNFKHWETYNPETGTAESFLVSLVSQKIEIKKLNLEVNFKKWESLHTEISQKYDDEVVEWLSGEANLQIEHVFTDTEKSYKDYVFGKKT